MCDNYKHTCLHPGYPVNDISFGNISNLAPKHYPRVAMSGSVKPTSLSGRFLTLPKNIKLWWQCLAMTKHKITDLKMLRSVIIRLQININEAGAAFVLEMTKQK